MSLKKPLTLRQRTVLEFIEKFTLRYGNSPTIREIGSDLGISSTNGVRSHLDALIKKGYLKKTGLISRGLSLVKKLSVGVARIPLVGSVPAGYPIDSPENVEGDLAVDESFLPNGESFTLTVMGDSMKGAGIYNGDLVIVKKQSEANKGDIVVAIVSGEATIKRYLPGNGLIILQPENNDFKPITVTPESGEFRIAGRVVGLMRRFA